MKLNKLLRILALLVLVVVVMAAAPGTVTHAQSVDESLPPLTDLSISAKPRSGNTSWVFTVKGNRVGHHPLARVRNVKVRFSVDTVRPSPQFSGLRSPLSVAIEQDFYGHYDQSSMIWTIPELLTQRENFEEASAIVHAPKIQNVGTAVVRLKAEIIGAEPMDPPGFDDNNAVEVYSEGARHSRGDAGVNIDISDRSPGAGGATTFTVIAFNSGLDFPRALATHLDYDYVQLGVQLKIELSQGLTFSGPPSAPSGTAFSATTGIWNVGTLEAADANAKSLPVAVNLTSDSLADLPLEKRCLTATVIKAVPWYASDYRFRWNDTATACLGKGLQVELHQDEITLFRHFDCVGVTNYPCTSDDTLELFVTNDAFSSRQLRRVWEREVTRGRGLGLGNSTPYLRPEQVTVHVQDPIGRHDGKWRTGTTEHHHGSVDTIRGIEATLKYIPSGFSAYNFAISDVSPKQRPGTFSIIGGSRATFTLVDSDTKTSDGPYSPTNTVASKPYPVFLSFGSLGTYKIKLTIGATKSGNAYTASGTYTFHVGPMVELEVRDAGPSRAVAADRQAYTVMAVNYGPDEAPAVQVTGLPTGVIEYAASEGSYDPASGVWTIGRLGIGDKRSSGHADEGPTLTLITDDNVGSEITAEIENTQDYSVVIDGTTHSTEYYDYININNAETIVAQAGTGEGHLDAPAGVNLMETSVANILMWDSVARVNGHEVSHYEVQRGESSWTTLAYDVKGRVYADMDLRPGQLMQYRVRAVNIFGIGGPWSQPTLTGPDAPGDFHAEQLQGGEVRLTWTKPDGNGAEITGYTLQVSTNGGQSWSDTGARLGPDDTSWVHSNLSVGPVRLYRIRASTANGHGPWAQATSASIAAPILTADYGGPSEIELSWTMPAGNAVPVQSWELQHSADGANWSRLATVMAADGMTYTHSGLSPGDLRRYRVRAVTSLGPGPWSETAQAVTAAGIPRNFRAEANGPSEIALTWTKPAGNAEIWGYQLQRKTEGVDWSLLTTVYSEDGTSYVDGGLSAGGTWSYRLRAISIVDGNLLEGDWTAEVSATTDSGGPESPKDLLAEADGENTIKLSWTEPEDNGSPITGYRIEHSGDGGETWTLLRDRHSDTTYSHTGLPSGTTHHYRVAAINRNGMSTFASEVSATTGGDATTVPGIPANLRVTGVDRNRVSIAWDPPEHDGGARVTGYEYRYTGPCAAAPADVCESDIRRVGGTSASVSGLNAAGEYHFMVRAVNAVGAGEWAGPVQADIAPEVQGRVVVTPASLTVSEGGSATYRVRLSHEPSQPIQLGLFSEDPDDVLSGDALAARQGMLLLPGNYTPPEGALWDGWAYRWNVGIPIVVEANEDCDTEDGTAVIQNEVWTAPADLLGNPPDYAEDPVYHFVSGPAVKVTVRDIKVADGCPAPQQSSPGAVGQPTAITLSLDAASVSESAGQMTVTATLDAPAPVGGVAVALYPDPDAGSTADRDADYTMPHSIAIAAGERSGTAVITVADDALDEADETVSLAAVAISDAIYDNLTAAAVLTIIDDDTAGVTVSAAGPLAVAEGGAATYTVVLDSRPTADVTVSAISGDGAKVSVSPGANTFTPSAWNKPLTFTVSGVADTDTSDESVGISHGIASDDGNYAAVLVPSVTVAVTDNTQQQQQESPNSAPTVSSAIADATIVSDSGTRDVSLSGVFSDADSDALTVDAVSSDEAVATVSVSSDQSTLTVTAKSRGTTTVTATADDGRGGTVENAFTVAVKAAPLVASAIGDMSLEAEDTRDVSLSGAFSDADGDTLTITAASSDDTVVSAFVFQETLTILALAGGSATVTVTAEDADGNTVGDTFDVSVAPAEVDHGEPTPVANLRCTAKTDQVVFLWDEPDWSGGEVYAYDYDLTLPTGQRGQTRLRGSTLVRHQGDYQVGKETSISVKVVYKLSDESKASSAAETLTCTVRE